MTAAARALVRRVVADARTRTLSFAALFFAVVWANAAGYRSSYPNLADRAKFVANFAGNKAARMLYGAGHALTTIGGYTAWRAGSLTLFAGLFGIFAATRAMRTEEDNGRAELVLAGSLSRTQAFEASIVGIALTIAALIIATAVGGVAGGLPFSGSCFLAITVLSVAGVYASIGAVANQIFPTRRSALGIAGGLLGADFLVRVVADTTDHYFIHWFTPLGWAEEMRAFTGSRAVVLVLPVLTIGLLVPLAAWLRAHRDLGGAYVAPHDTAPAKAGLLSSPFALALRLERITIASWAGAIAAFAFVIGTVAKSVEKLQLSGSLRSQLAKLGGVDIATAKGYVGLTFVIFVFVIALFVCGQVSAARDEESTHRLETLFALPYGRNRWMRGRIVLVLGGAILCALVAGTGAGVGVLVSGGRMTFLQGLAGGVNAIPTEVLFIGAGVLLLGIAPRRGIGVLYALVVATFVLELFGALLNFPNWVLALSPFHHVAPTPARPMAIPSALTMTAIGAVLAIAGARLFDSRDLAGD